MKDGTLITTIFAKFIISKIETMNMSSIYIPGGFKNGWFDSPSTNYECKAEDCYLNADGMWVTKTNTSTDGRGNYINQNRFLWRIEPNYCCAGKPFFSAERINYLYKKSETKKTLITSGKSAICLEWFEFKHPTDTCWGLSQGPVYVTVYENHKRIKTISKSINEKGWKKEFIEFVETYYKWNPNAKD
jgi:hypothetical protein